MTTTYRRFDTDRPDGVYVTYHRVTHDDASSDPLDYLFQDPDYRAEDQARLDAWKRGDWGFVGVTARAVVEVVRNGFGALHELESPGIWGIESDSGEEYLAEAYADECHNIKADIEALMHLPLFYPQEEAA